MKKYYYEEGKYTINRDDPCYPHMAVCVDEEGKVFWIVNEIWSDFQIDAAIRLANKFYDIGVRDGEELKAYEIKKTLGLL